MADENLRPQNDIGENDDTVLTMVDVLKEEQELENDANAVLGGSDERDCSYTQGYVKRQALYACVTCAGPEAGVCLACSIKCHKNHELIELYTKRNFRCDCGNSKFPTNPCQLCPEKDPVNELNRYNHNFKGIYCTCNKPYPDPEDEVPDAMIQCILCEDWFHGRHLASNVPDLDEMICKHCMKEHSFLSLYNQAESSSPLVDVVTTEGEEENIKPSDLQKLAKKEGECFLQILKAKFSPDSKEGPTFWTEGWRERLCNCPQCRALYKRKGCEHLLDPEDTVQSYEERGKSRHLESQYDAGMNALGQLNRAEQIEAIHGYNDMASELKEYLRKFADNKKVVRAEDIQEFFMQIRARKRPRLQLPHFCH